MPDERDGPPVFEDDSRLLKGPLFREPGHESGMAPALTEIGKTVLEGDKPKDPGFRIFAEPVDPLEDSEGIVDHALTRLKEAGVSGDLLLVIQTANPDVRWAAVRSPLVKGTHHEESRPYLHFVPIGRRLSPEDAEHSGIPLRRGQTEYSLIDDSTTPVGPRNPELRIQVDEGAKIIHFDTQQPGVRIFSHPNAVPAPAPKV